MSPSSDRKRILIIDHEKNIVETMSYLLRKKGYSVSTASSGYAALDILKRSSFHLAILNVKLIFMNGFEILGAIQTSCSSLKIILLGRNINMEFIEKGLKMGAADYVIKPFSVDDLTIKISKALQA